MPYGFYEHNMNQQHFVTMTLIRFQRTKMSSHAICLPTSDANLKSTRRVHRLYCTRVIEKPQSRPSMRFYTRCYTGRFAITVNSVQTDYGFDSSRKQRPCIRRTQLTRYMSVDLPYNSQFSLPSHTVLLSPVKSNGLRRLSRTRSGGGNDEDDNNGEPATTVR